MIASWILPLVLLVPAAVDVGDVVEPFSLADIRFLPRTLDELGGATAYVLVFTTCDCPIARRYTPRLVELEREYRDRGIRFLLVNPSPGDSMTDVATDMVENEISFPVFKDFGAVAARALGITRTPEAVVLDGAMRLCYRGRIDAMYRLGGVRSDRGREDLREAIDDVLAGRAVRVATTTVDGCRLTHEAEIEPDPSLDWAEEVAPIFMANCVACHRPGGEAPFSLLDYEPAAANAAMIAEVVFQRRMPPWYASERHGEFSNRRGLTVEERRTIRTWAASGARQGDPSRAPAPPDLPATEWEIGEPDLLIRQFGRTRVPADGYVPYQYVILPYVFLHDTWVQAIQIRPENRGVLHHANLAYVKVGEKYHPQNFLTGQVPGGDPMQLDHGSAVMIPAGSVLALQAHYVTSGREEQDRLSVGIRYPRERIQQRLRHHQITNTRFEIPPGSPAHEVRASRTYAEPITGVGLFSHMHLRGRDMTFVATYPGGEEEVLLMVPNYSFDWQMSYRWSDGRRFPAGTRIEVVAHYDNSAFNPYNPDPGAAVRFGLQTYHEMMYGFFFYTVDGERLDLAVDPTTGRVQN